MGLARVRLGISRPASLYRFAFSVCLTLESVGKASWGSGRGLATISGLISGYREIIGIAVWW